MHPTEEAVALIARIMTCEGKISPYSPQQEI